MINKLPVWRTVGDAYAFCFTNPMTVLRTCWAAFIAYALLIAAFFHLSPYMAMAAQLSHAAGQSAPVPPNLPPVSLGFGFLVFLLYLAAVALGLSSHIAIHRAVLLGEQSWTATLQFGRRFWRTFGVGLLVSLMIMPALLVFGLIAILLQATLGKVSHVIFFVGMLAYLIVLLRLCIFAPAIAIDDPAGAIRAAWRRSRGNTWRLFFSFLCMSLSLWVILMGVLLLLLVIGTVLGVGFFAATSAASHTSPEQTAPAFGLVVGVISVVGACVIAMVATTMQFAFISLVFKRLASNWNPPPALPITANET